MTVTSSPYLSAVSVGDLSPLVCDKAHFDLDDTLSPPPQPLSLTNGKTGVVPVAHGLGLVVHTTARSALTASHALVCECAREGCLRAKHILMM